jgi:serine/threonine protein phosphatase PrpC
MMGVFDGHGINGHLVSDFCKRNIPLTLSSLINTVGGVNDRDAALMSA